MSNRNPESYTNNLRKGLFNKEVTRRVFLKTAGLLAGSLIVEKLFRSSTRISRAKGQKKPVDTPNTVYLPLVERQININLPREDLIQQAYEFYSPLLGERESLPSPEQLIYEVKENLNNQDQPPIVFARDPQTNQIILATRYNRETQERQWYVAKLRDLADALGQDIGFTVSRAENWQDSRYRETVLDNATIIIPSGEFAQTTMDVYGEHLADPYIDWAIQNNRKLRIDGLFWHQDLGEELEQIIETSETDQELRQNISDYMDRRIIRVLNVIPTEARENLPIEIVFANEALWYSVEHGTGGYVGGLPNDPPSANPYFYAFGPQWLTEAYVRTINIANEMGFDIGNLKMIYNEYDIELPGPKAELVKQELSQRKQEIAQRLGIPISQVELYVGMQFHLKAPGHPAEYRVDVGLLDKQVLVDHFRDLANYVGPVLLTELDFKGDDRSRLPEAIETITEACLEVGPTICPGLSFWSVLNNNSSEGQTLFDTEDFTPSDAYYSMIRTLSKNIT